MKINALLYKDMSDSASTVWLETGKTIKENLPDEDFSHKIILIDGKKADENHKVKNNEHIIIRDTPAGATAALVALIVVAIVVAVVVGVALYNKRKAAQKKTDNKDMEKDEVQNRPFLKGAQNSVATSKTQPYFIGENLFTPYILNAGGNNYKGFSTISGTDGKNQFYNVVLEGGFNKQVLRKLFCDDVVLKTFDGNTPQEGVYSFDATSVFYDAESVIEIAQDGLPFTTSVLNQKIVEQQSNNQLQKHDSENYQPLTFTLERYSMAADVEIIFNGLIAYTDEGYKRDRTVVVVPYYSLDNGATWTGFSFNQNGALNNSFTRRTVEQLRFVAHIDFNFNAVKNLQHPILIKVECNTNAYDGSAYDDVYVEWVHSYVYTPDKSTNSFVAEKIIDEHEGAQSTLIGLRIKSTPDNEDKLSKINFVSTGIARIYDSEAGEWSNNKVPTSNPAAWLIEVMTSDTHKPSQTDDEEIDFESFAELYEYCEEQNYRIDMVLTEGQTKQSLLQDICNVCDCMLYQNIYGKVAVAIDTYKPNAVALFNSQNIINLEYTKEFARDTDGIKMTYVNREADFAEDTYLVMKDGRTRNADSILREMTLKGITTHEHVVKNARRLMATAELRPRQLSIEVGKEGVYFTPFSKILVQNNELKIGLGHAEIKAVIVSGANIIGLELYEPIEYDSQDENGFGVVINAVGEDYCTPLAKAYTAQKDGRNMEILFVEPIPLNASAIPHAGDILSYGYLDNGAFDKITSAFLIMSLEPTKNGYKMTCVDYNEAIYNSGTIPEYKPNLTQPRTPPQAIQPPSDALAIVNELSAALIDGSKEVGAPDTVTNIVAKANRDTIEISCGAFTLGLRNSIEKVFFEIQKGENAEWIPLDGNGLNASYSFDRHVDGYPEAEELETWQIRAKAKNIYGEYSESYGYGGITVSGYGSWQVAAPVITKRENNRAVTLYFSQPARADNRVRYGTVRHRVQIKRISEPADSEFYKPATSADPRAAEANYKDGTGYVIAAESYSQTLPLINQNLTDPVPQDTSYQFSVIAYNEAGVSETATVINAVAHATSIEDIVANAIGSAQIKQDAVTADKIYVRMLSAIQENLGYITGGVFEGTENNRWALSTVTLEDGSTRYEGAMRVGGDDEYFEVIPYNIVNGVPQNYHVKFKAGDFEISAQASNINGILYVIEKESALDRTAITPQGTFYQHRDNPAGDWYNICYSHTNGFMSSQFFSEKNLVITNQTMAQRRQNGLDIGAAMPSENALVYHFDTDYLNQHQTNGLVIEDAPDGEHMLAGAADTSADIDFTPAILTISPYTTVGKSLYGQCAVTGNFGNSSGEYSIDFWEQYIYAENQVLFDVGTANERVKLVTANRECYLFGIFEDENVPMFEEMRMSRLFYRLAYSESVPMFSAETDECAMFAPGADECAMFYNLLPEKPYNETYEYYELTADEEVEQFEPVELTESEYYTQLESGVYVRTCEMNTPRGAYRELQHLVNGVVVEAVTFAALGLEFEPNSWVHFGIFADSEKTRLCVNSLYHDFTRAETAGQITINLNQNKTSVIIDELMIDTTTAATFANFLERTQKRIPFGTLAESDNWFILTARNPEKIKTNLFEAPQFVEAVEAVLRAHNLIGE